MVLIKCEECGKEISNKATHCISCGCLIEQKKESINVRFDDIAFEGYNDSYKKNMKVRRVFAFIILLVIMITVISVVQGASNFAWLVMAIVIAVLLIIIIPVIKKSDRIANMTKEEKILYERNVNRGKSKMYKHI